MDRATAYDDVYAWCHEQAALLRSLRETRPDLSNALDVENLCEEIEGLGEKTSTARRASSARSSSIS